MNELLQFAVIGLGVGALYAFGSMGLVIIYRGSGVLNLAYGGIALAGAYVYAELVGLGLPTPVCIIGGTLASAVLGGLTHLLVMRQLRRASPLARVVATLGILLILQALATLRYGGKTTFVAPILPFDAFRVGGINVTVDRLILLSLAIVLTIVLSLVYQRTKFGLGTSAVAEDERAAASLGWSAEMIATINWALGSALGGLTAILIAPIVTLQVGGMATLLLTSLATALVASFRSIPVVLVAGVVIGVAQSITTLYNGGLTGLSEALPFIVIVLMLAIRGRSLPLRDYLLQRLPAIGSGRVRTWLVVLGLAVSAAIILTTPASWVVALTITLAMGLVLMSIVVLTGYAGQLSLAQMAFAGFGALVAGRLIAAAHFPPVVAIVVGVVAAIPLGLIFGLPALRTRGITLAVVTLGLGSAMQVLLFNNEPLTGGLYGTHIGKLNIFGFSISGIDHPERYALTVLVVFTLVALLVARIRRSVLGRRMIAVRTNERAAASLGLNVSAVKLFAFALAAGIAAMGGIALVFNSDSVLYSAGFDPFSSIAVVGYAVIGGLGFIFGPVMGGTLAPGGLGTAIVDLLPGQIAGFLPLISGILVVALVLGNQDGAVKETIQQLAWLGSKIRRGAISDPKPMVLPAPMAPEPVEPKTLAIRGVTVKFGATMALNNVSFDVAPGEVLGLIGPNGAGKTTLIDAVTGFVPLSAGSIELNGVAVQALRPYRRARMGISRSFQSLELFEDSTVLDNLLSASDDHGFSTYFTSIFRRNKNNISPALAGLIREVQLEAHLHALAQSLPFGMRHLLSIVRSVASRPSVLLLDEPAAGLDDSESRELVHVVRKLAREWNIAVLLIEHDMNFVMSLVDRLVVLDFGRVIASGEPPVVREDPVVLTAYLGEEEESDFSHSRESTEVTGGVV